LYPSTLAPLVRTVHNQQNNEYTIDEDGLPLQDEIYVIEPQSGTIYIIPSDPTSTQTPPLRRFPFTMPELVDMSPFSFSDPDGHSRLEQRERVSDRQPAPQDCKDSEGEVDEAEGAENDAAEARGPAPPPEPIDALASCAKPSFGHSNAYTSDTSTAAAHINIDCFGYNSWSVYVPCQSQGFGSHGAVVFRGSLQGRSVAVKL
ncbi:hypothetical protein F5878DRAFT_693758, partial [Lentinula raphanica]